MAGFDNMIYTFQQWGVIDVILPFILIFTIVFAVLEKTKILGEKDYQVRKYAAIIAMVTAFAVVVPHITGAYYYGFDAVQVINNALPQVGLLLVAIVMMLLTIGLWTGKKADGTKGAGVWFTMTSVFIVIAIFVASLGWWNVPRWMFFALNSELIALVIAILVFGIIINFIAKGDDPANKKEKKPLSKDFQEFLQG